MLIIFCNPIKVTNTCCANVNSKTFIKGSDDILINYNIMNKEYQCYQCKVNIE